MGGKVRATYPVASNSLRPDTPNDQQLRLLENNEHVKQKRYFNRRHGTRVNLVLETSS